MKITKYNEAAQARLSRLSNAFRELIQSRMLWATGGIAIVGLMAGFVFFNDLVNLPLMNRPKPPASTATVKNVSPDLPPTVEEMPVVTAIDDTPKTGQVLGSDCDTTARGMAEKTRTKDQKAEANRFANAMSGRRGAKHLFSAITGAVLQTSTAEVQKHEARVAQINAAYQAALVAANCN